MQCPKCKQEIEDKSLKCSFCGARVGSLCKHCGEYNLITAKTCEACGEALLRICSECGAANLPDAPSCRKCGIDFLSEETKEDLKQPMHFADMNSQQRVKAKLLEGIKDANVRVISLCGESGLGKNFVLRYAINDLKNAKLIWLLGSCTQVSQMSPFGYFQEVLLNFFNINNFCPDTMQLKKNSMKFFRQDFPSLSNNEILDLLNFLYPDKYDKYENIYFNKAKMFSIMKKVITTIIEKMKVIFIVDNFEQIDGMSYDFIKELLKEDLVLEKSKFIFLCKESRPSMGLVSSPKLDTENYLNLSIAPFTPTQIETLLKQYTGAKFGSDFVNTVIKNSGGNPSVVEQMVFLQKESKLNNRKNINYGSIEAVMEQRLNILKTGDWKAYRLLAAMSVLGVKFYPAMLENFDNNTSKEFERIISKLVNLGYITQLNSLSFEFKSCNIWRAIVSVVKNDGDCFEEILNILYELLSTYKQSSVALLGYITQKLNNYDKAFDVWTILMKQASYIGDIGLYIISQKQALKLIENKAGSFYAKVRKNIHIRIGKLLEPIDCEASFDNLRQAVMMLEDYEEPLHIELLGYIASCSMKTGNYWGAIECVENVLNKIPETSKFEQILVKSRLTTPLLKLGNYGQLINLTETELLGELEKVISKGKNTPIIKMSDLFDLWLGVYFDYAEALVFQGDNRALGVIKDIYDILDKNKIVRPELTCRANLMLALANTIRGDISTSGRILEDMLKENTPDNMDSFIISRWNFIDILNKFFEKNYSVIKTELFNIVAYANNVNDNFTKNILKTMLAKILKENNQTKKALEILEEQVSYFAKEKVSTGVLLSWYLIAEIKLITSGTQFALDIATKALDIAQTPNINNYYFIALFNKLIGEIYLAKQDFDSAKVYFEKAIFISKQFGLEHILVKTYLQCARLYQELALPKTSARHDYIKKAIKMLQLSKNVSVVAEQKALQREIKENLNILTSFCKLNGIVLKKDSK